MSKVSYTRTQKERKRYRFDYTNWLDTGEQVQEIQYSITNNTSIMPLVVDGIAVNSDGLGGVYYISGGGPNITYNIQIDMVSTQGQVREDLVLVHTLASFPRVVVLPLDYGSFTYRGFDATLTQHTVPLAETGHFTLTWFPVTLTYTIHNTIMQAGVGGYALTGYDANLSRATSMSADMGSFTLTGKPVTFTLVHGSNFLLNAAGGNYTLTGFAISKRVGLAAGQGAFTLTGQTVTLTYTPAAASPGLAMNMSNMTNTYLLIL